MSRLFTFGCSFTRYHWPTWADILGREFDHFENWAYPGAGNQYIFNSLIECNQRNKFTSEDTVIIMWSTLLREDRYTKESNGWICSGNIITAPIYSDTFKKKFVCERGFFIRDIALIAAAQNLLQYYKTNYKVLSLMPLLGDNDIVELYKSVLDTVGPAFVDTVDIYNRSESIWNFFTKKTKPDKFFLQEFKNHYNFVKGDSWPKFETFLNGETNYIEKSTLDDINSYDLYHQLRRITHQYADHPCPKEHLLFVQRVFPTHIISNTTNDWINNYKFGDSFDFCLPNKRL